MLLQVFILEQTELLPQLLSAFMAGGIKGTTVVDCEGALQVIDQASVDAPPIFGSLRQYLNPGHAKGKLLLTVLPDDMVPTALDIIADIVGDISLPHMGIYFTVPITHVKGLAK